MFKIPHLSDGLVWFPSLNEYAIASDHDARTVSSSNTMNEDRMQSRIGKKREEAPLLACGWRSGRVHGDVDSRQSVGAQERAIVPLFAKRQDGSDSKSAQGGIAIFIRLGAAIEPCIDPTELMNSVRVEAFGINGTVVLIDPASSDGGPRCGEQKT